MIFGNRKGVVVLAQSFSNELIEELDNYVYIYSDPVTKEVFYVGKGTGNRATSHLYFDENDTERKKIKKIAEIRKTTGQDPKIEILRYGLDKDTAFAVESAVIDLIGLKNLTNEISGHESMRIEYEELISQFADELKPEELSEKVMFIRPTKLYYEGIPAPELYDITRGYWDLDKSLKRAKQAKYVFSIYNFRILEVYEVYDWVKGGTTFMGPRKKDSGTGGAPEGTFEFIGRIANKRIHNKYVNKTVRAFYKPGDRTSFKYINIPL